jgi:hypothetical protein
MVANMRCDVSPYTPRIVIIISCCLFYFQITNAKTGALIAAGTHTKVDVFSRTKGKLDEVIKKVGYHDATQGKVVAKL